MEEGEDEVEEEHRADEVVREEEVHRGVEVALVGEIGEVEEVSVDRGVDLVQAEAHQGVEVSLLEVEGVTRFCLVHLRFSIFSLPIMYTFRFDSNSDSMLQVSMLKNTRNSATRRTLNRYS